MLCIKCKKEIPANAVYCSFCGKKQATKEKGKREKSRGAQGAGSIRKRPDGYWEARYTVGIHPGTGKQIQKSVYAKTQRAALDKLTVKLQAVNTNTYTDPVTLTVAQWMDIWSQDYLNGVKPNTVSQYRTQIRCHIQPGIGAVKLQSLTTNIIQQFYNAEQKAGLSPKSIKNLNGVLHKALDQALRLGYIAINPINNIVLPKINKKEIVVFSNEQLSNFLKIAATDSFADIFMVTVFTGMRQGEVLGLTWDCIDFEKHRIHINKQLNKQRLNGTYSYNLIPLKNDKPRTIQPAEYVIHLLQEVYKKQQNLVIKNPAYDNPMGLVFTNSFGDHICHTTLYNHFKNLAKQINCPNARFHDLRHTYATISLQNGDDIKTVSSNLGHATVSFTLDVYGHVNATMQQQSATRMEAYIQTIS